MDNQDRFIELVNVGVDAVRNNSTNTKIILHCAGFESSNWFFNIAETSAGFTSAIFFKF